MKSQQTLQPRLVHRGGPGLAAGRFRYETPSLWTWMRGLPKREFGKEVLHHPSGIKYDPVTEQLLIPKEFAYDHETGLITMPGGKTSHVSEVLHEMVTRAPDDKLAKIRPDVKLTPAEKAGKTRAERAALLRQKRIDAIKAEGRLEKILEFDPKWPARESKVHHVGWTIAEVEGHSNPDSRQFFDVELKSQPGTTFVWDKNTGQIYEHDASKPFNVGKEVKGVVINDTKQFVADPVGKAIPFGERFAAGTKAQGWISSKNGMGVHYHKESGRLILPEGTKKLGNGYYQMPNGKEYHVHEILTGDAGGYGLGLRREHQWQASLNPWNLKKHRHVEWVQIGEGTGEADRPHLLQNTFKGFRGERVGYHVDLEVGGKTVRGALKVETKANHAVITVRSNKITVNADGVILDKKTGKPVGHIAQHYGDLHEGTEIQVVDAHKAPLIPPKDASEFRTHCEEFETSNPALAKVHPAAEGEHAGAAEEHSAGEPAEREPGARAADEHAPKTTAPEEGRVSFMEDKSIPFTERVGKQVKHNFSTEVHGKLKVGMRSSGVGLGAVLVGDALLRGGDKDKPRSWQERTIEAGGGALLAVGSAIHH